MGVGNQLVTRSTCAQNALTGKNTQKRRQRKKKVGLHHGWASTGKKICWQGGPQFVRPVGQVPDGGTTDTNRPDVWGRRGPKKEEKNKNKMGQKKSRKAKWVKKRGWEGDN